MEKVKYKYLKQYFLDESNIIPGTVDFGFIKYQDLKKNALDDINFIEGEKKRLNNNKALILKSASIRAAVGRLRLMHQIVLKTTGK